MNSTSAATLKDSSGMETSRIPTSQPTGKRRSLHARIEIGGTVVMGADIPQAEPMRSAYLSLTVDREQDAERLYALLTDGGEVFMKLDKTPFANRFAMVRDRFRHIMDAAASTGLPLRRRDDPGVSRSLVVFLRGVNVGGHRTFRPSALARKLSKYDVVNVGAAGTFVVRKPGSRTAFRAELLRRLPFGAEVVLCDGRDLVRLQTENPFGKATTGPDVVRFVSFLSKAARVHPSLPIVLPADGDGSCASLPRRIDWSSEYTVVT
jgi:uncharacterized glyoxalase superfamily protein PhnB